MSETQVSPSDLQFYLTTAEPSTTQSDPSQSLGGYPSDTQYCPYGSLLFNINSTATSIPLSTSLGTDLLIDQEIIQTEGNGTNPTVVNRGAFSTIPASHNQGTLVYSLSSNALFNNAFSSQNSQYRCLAVTNNSSANTFFALSFYFKNVLTTPYTLIQMAIENPKTDIYPNGGISYANSGTMISITDNGLEGFPDNWFVGCVVKMTSGLNVGVRRTVISFDGSSLSLVVSSAFPYPVSSGDTYMIQNAPAQIINNGTSTPAFGTSYVSPLYRPTFSSMLSIDVNRSNNADLYPNETVYLWLSRTLTANTPEQLNQRVIFTANYNTTNLVI